MPAGGDRDFRTARQALQERPKPGGADPPRVRASRRRRHHAQRGERPIIEPAPPKSLLALLATLVPLDEEFPPSLTQLPIPSSFDALPARYQHRLRPRPQSTRPSGGAHLQGWRGAGLHQHHRRGRVTLRGHEKGITGARETARGSVPRVTCSRSPRPPIRLTARSAPRLEQTGRPIVATICSLPLRPWHSGKRSSRTMRRRSRGSTGFLRELAAASMRNRDRAAHGIDDAGKLRQHAVAGGLGPRARPWDAATVLGDLRIDELMAQGFEAFQGAFLVRSHQPTVTGDVSRKDRSEPAGLAHFASPAARRRPDKYSSRCSASR